MFVAIPRSCGLQMQCRTFLLGSKQPSIDFLGRKALLGTMGEYRHRKASLQEFRKLAPYIPHPLSRGYPSQAYRYGKDAVPSQLWSMSSTPTPLPRKLRHPHHVFGNSLYNCRLLAYVLGVLTNFFGKKKEE